MKMLRGNIASIMAESALAFPIMFFMIFSLVELGRAMYVINTLQVAAQKAASEIAQNARPSPNYSVGNFSSYVSSVRFPISVTMDSQFSFDLRDGNNSSTVSGGVGDGTTSKKVVVTVSFPAPGDTDSRIPMFDPGNLLGMSVFGSSGLQLMSTATAFMERAKKSFLPSSGLNSSSDANNPN